MKASKNFPGTFHHQQILQTITAFYDDDDRVLAILLFGSLSRGNWDQYSDIDLDIILSDNTLIDARSELRKLCAAIKQKHEVDALIIADVEEGDVVLGNLVEFSVRYHVLSDTKPAILGTMCSLSGALSLDEIRAAANHKYDAEPREMVDIIDECIRYILAVHHAIMRQRVWMAIELFYRIRASLMQLYATSHGAIRPIHFFDSHATAELHELLSTLSPLVNPKAIEDVFSTAILLLENHLDDFSDGLYQLTASQKHILDELKQLQIYREKN